MAGCTCRVRVAAELKDIVQRQQEQLEQRLGASHAEQGRLGSAGSRANGSREWDAADHAGAPHIAQLQRLVREMRAELRHEALAGGDADLPAPRDSLPAAAAAAANQQLQAELRSTQQQLSRLQAAHGALLELQQQQAAAGGAADGGTADERSAQAEAEHHRRAAEVAVTERDRIRKALIDAEIELQVGLPAAFAPVLVGLAHGGQRVVIGQPCTTPTPALLPGSCSWWLVTWPMCLPALQRTSNDASMLRQQLAAAEQGRAQLSSTKAALEQQLQEAVAEAAALQADGALLKQQLAGVTEAERQHSVEQVQQLQSNVVRLTAALAAAEGAATAQRRQREAAEALVAQLQSQVVQLQAATSANTTSAEAEASVLQQQLAVAERAAQQAQQETRTLQQQLASVKEAHGRALNAASSAQQQLAEAQEARQVLAVQLEVAQQELRLVQQRPATAVMVMERDTEIRWVAG